MHTLLDLGVQAQMGWGPLQGCSLVIAEGNLHYFLCNTVTAYNKHCNTKRLMLSVSAINISCDRL